MKKRGKVIGIVAVVAVAALCLVACGGSGGGSAATSSGSESAASSSGAQADNSIYVVKHLNVYSSMGEGESKLTSETDYEYDEHGNAISTTTKNTDPMTNETKTSTTKFSDFDENGYYGTYELGDGASGTMEWTIENGHAVKLVNDDGTTVEFTYYDDGKMKSQVSHFGEVTLTIEYDENGCLVKRVYEGDDNAQTTENAWVLDAQGRAESATSTTTMKSTGEKFVDEQTFDCDENGYITAIYRDGSLWREMEYKKIDNPSTSAWISAQAKDI